MVADILGVEVTTVYRWLRPKGVHKGSGGYVPAGQAHQLLERALARGIPLAPDDFFELSDQARAQLAARQHG